jgi:hypothetical protein
VSVDQTSKLVDQHKKLFKKFWAWADGELRKYKRQKHLTMWDGWTLLGDNESDLSTKNFSVQGTGAVIMRLAVQKCHDAGIRIMNPLHDALYVRCKEEDEEATVKILCDCMLEACYDVLGKGLDIRNDVDIHTHDDVWIEGKGKKNYARLGKFLKPLEKGERAIMRRLERILGSV